MTAFSPKWTTAEDDYLREAVAANKLYREIGAYLGRTKNAVVGRVDRLRRSAAMPLALPSHHVSGLNTMMGQTGDSVTYNPINPINPIGEILGRSWTAAEDAVLRTGIAADKTYRQIGLELGRSAASACGRAKLFRERANLAGRGHLDNAARHWLRTIDDGRLPGTPLTERFAEGYLGQTGRLSIMDLKWHTCRFPITHSTGETRYCGLTVKDRSAYCETHTIRCQNFERGR